jgi:elongator complex protein 4
MFPSYHGVLHVHTLPAPHSLLPPSDKFSILRGLAASAASSGENNLTFKCTRKRLIFETLHLDIEGGVGERRTAPSSIGVPSSEEQQVALAAVEVALEGEKIGTEVLECKPKKGRKKVAFRSDRPDLYDF